MKNNPYYIADNGGLNKEQLVNMKKNNYYVYKALTHVFRNVHDNNPKIGGPYRPALLSGELQKNDKLTGMNTNDLGGKLKFLVTALSDQNHPENIQAFKKSFFYQNILTPMLDGVTVDPDSQWLNYKHTSSYETTFKNKSSLDAALICQRDDENAPLGLDFSKIIDSFVKTDDNGHYYLEDSYTVEEETQMLEAMDSQLKSLKGNTRFKASYVNPKANALEDSMEDEDELE